jgi:hypothetical protein
MVEAVEASHLKTIQIAQRHLRDLKSIDSAEFFLTVDLCLENGCSGVSIRPQKHGRILEKCH